MNSEFVMMLFPTVLYMTMPILSLCLTDTCDTVILMQISEIQCAIDWNKGWGFRGEVLTGAIVGGCTSDEDQVPKHYVLRLYKRQTSIWFTLDYNTAVISAIPFNSYACCPSRKHS